MTQGREVVSVNKETGEVLVQPKTVELTNTGIDIVARNIKMAEKLVTQVLERDVDYGIQPGTTSMALRDPGSSKIANAFNCYPQHNILQSQDNEDVISYVIQANMVSRDSGLIVSVGVGGCSTREAKYASRWVKNPEVFGLNKEDFRHREEDDKYRIPNPDIEDLGNTILKMAAKRAEVDSCQNLPGVGSALRKLFDPKLNKTMAQAPTGQTGQEDLTLPTFWSMVKGAGLTEDEVHNSLKVKSLKEWKDAGKTYRDAVQYIMRMCVGAVRGQRAKNAPQSGTPPAPKVKVFASAKDVTQADVNSVDDLARIVSEIWKMGEVELFNELGYSERANFEEAMVQTPWEAFQAVKDVRPA